jgi:hypothetical protein
MIARLVESGQMQWTDTIGEIFPEASVHEDWKPVTLRQLLTDTAGAPASFPKEVSGKRPPLGSERTQARQEAVLNLLADKPSYTPGKKYFYSNVGYTIAGAMAEKVTCATWEDPWLDQERTRQGNPTHGLLAQRVEHDVIRAGGVFPRDEHGSRRHIERRRLREC